MVRSRLSMVLGSASLENNGISDNLAIALCTYFSDHLDRPKDDPDTEHGWGEWVERMADAALERIATVVKEAGYAQTVTGDDK